MFRHAYYGELKAEVSAFIADGSEQFFVSECWTSDTEDDTDATC